ncbi:MAG: glycosyltransferase [Pyrinomonadaceae bacterium]
MFVFYFFAAILIFSSYKSFRGGLNYLNFFKQELSKPKSDYAPLCSIIAPCRGLDEDLEKNLSALFEQEFPAYEIIFVVDSERDAAVSIIESVQKKFHRRGAETQGFSKIVFAGKAENESQKVHNLREAVLNVSDESKIFVFVDSDARPAANW